MVADIKKQSNLNFKCFCWCIQQGYNLMPPKQYKMEVLKSFVDIYNVFVFQTVYPMGSHLLLHKVPGKRTRHLSDQWNKKQVWVIENRNGIRAIIDGCNHESLHSVICTLPLMTKLLSSHLIQNGKINLCQLFTCQVLILEILPDYFKHPAFGNQWEWMDRKFTFVIIILRC